jgi:hypothetical protein
MVLHLLQCFNPHLHILAADGGFGGSCTFYAAATNLDSSTFEPLFRNKILSMLKKDLISESIIELISSWRHSGFNVYCSERIYPRLAHSMENPTGYIIRASFSSERLNSTTSKSRVIYRSKDGNTTKEFNAVDFIARTLQAISPIKTNRWSGK